MVAPQRVVRVALQRVARVRRQRAARVLQPGIPPRAILHRPLPQAVLRRSLASLLGHLLAHPVLAIGAARPPLRQEEAIPRCRNPTLDKMMNKLLELSVA